MSSAVHSDSCPIDHIQTSQPYRIINLSIKSGILEYQLHGGRNCLLGLLLVGLAARGEGLPALEDF